jgi:hypothetical protein
VRINTNFEIVKIPRIKKRNYVIIFGRNKETEQLKTWLKVLVRKQSNPYNNNVIALFNIVNSIIVMIDNKCSLALRYILKHLFETDMHEASNIFSTFMGYF